MTEEQEASIIATSVLNFLIYNKKRKEGDVYTLYNEWSSASGISITHPANISRAYEMLTHARYSATLDNSFFIEVINNITK